MDAYQIISEIDSHIHTCGGKKPDWYMGVAADAMHILFKEHGVDPYSSWIFRIADNADIARMVVCAYHKAGYDGSVSIAGPKAVAVYAYLKTAKTVP
jgi:hypothetical protein